MGLFNKDFSNNTDEELVVFLSKGKQRAFDELYARYSSNMLYFFMQKLKRDKEKAEDFTHDLFSKLIKRPESFDSSRNFKTWFYSVANNMVKNEYKRMEVRSNTHNGLNEDFGIESREEGSLDKVHWQDFSSKLSFVLSEIEDKHSEVFELRHLQEMQIKEIAEVLNISDGTVKSRLYHAHKKIAAKMSEYDPKIKR